MSTTPSVSGIAIARDLVTKGLSVEGPLVSGKPGEDIVRFRIGRRVGVALRHPDYVDHVLHEGTDAYHKSIEYELLRSVVGLSLFTDEDESWRRHRMLLNPVLAKRHVNGLLDLMLDPIEELVDGLEPGPIEMSGAMTELTLDVVGSALFGTRLGRFAVEIKPAVTGGLHGAEVATVLLMLFAPPVWSIRLAAGFVHHVPQVVPQLRRLQWVMKTVDRSVSEIIEERKAHPSDSPDLLGLLLAQPELTPKRVRDEATTFMLAGHETTANALAWTWYLLATNEDARERMLAEVDEVLGGRRPTVADLPQLRWTTACFEEGMRMYPPAWVIPREAVRDDVIDGHRIPKGATVMIPIHAIHHDARFWPDPERFDPSRFLPENAKGRHRSAYLPFGGGRRVCIGTSFALMEGALILAIMSQRFTYELDHSHRVIPEATLTLRPRRGIKMIARPRQVAQEVAA
ncbi:MAG TPA: cytochrome P450 [Solirubrobacteraceae bacterium]